MATAVANAHVFEQAIDLDSHEMMPTHFFGEQFGDIGRDVGAVWERFFAQMDALHISLENTLHHPEINGDVSVIDPNSIGSIKGPVAPGAIDMLRRCEVLDAMHIDTQLVFPGFGFLAFIIAVMQEEAFSASLLQECPPNYRAMGYEGVRAANAWAIQQSNLGGRQRHVVIVPTNDLDEMLQVAQQAIDGKAGALWLPSHIPPLGSSPAHPKMDPFWALAAANDIPVVFHINVDRALPVEWQDAPQLSARDQGRDGSVFPINAYFMSTCSIPVENYLLSLVLGGVFERHPSLRVGIIECGAHWLGPTVERMEMWWEQFPNMQKMSRRPTGYVADQVRVTPYFCEPVDVWLERFPQLADVYCFSSDYPHAEGGVDTMEKFYQRLVPFGDEILTKFFRTNAELLIPSTGQGSVGRS